MNELEEEADRRHVAVVSDIDDNDDDEGDEENSGFQPEARLWENQSATRRSPHPDAPLAHHAVDLNRSNDPVWSFFANDDGIWRPRHHHHQQGAVAAAAAQPVPLLLVDNGAAMRCIESHLAEQQQGNRKRKYSSLDLNELSSLLVRYSSHNLQRDEQQHSNRGSGGADHAAVDAGANQRSLEQAGFLEKSHHFGDNSEHATRLAYANALLRPGAPPPPPLLPPPTLPMRWSSKTRTMAECVTMTSRPRLVLQRQAPFECVHQNAAYGAWKKQQDQSMSTNGRRWRHHHQYEDMAIFSALAPPQCLEDALAALLPPLASTLSGGDGQQLYQSVKLYLVVSDAQASSPRPCEYVMVQLHANPGRHSNNGRLGVHGAVENDIARDDDLKGGLAEAHRAVG